MYTFKCIFTRMCVLTYIYIYVTCVCTCICIHMNIYSGVLSCTEALIDISWIYGTDPHFLS